MLNRAPCASVKYEKVTAGDSAGWTVLGQRQWSGHALPRDNIFRLHPNARPFGNFPQGPVSTYYITTAIEYPNGNPHLGHALEKIGADAFARYKRLKGFDVFLSTGVDEHSLNVAKTAREAGKSPQEFVDEMSPVFKGLWDGLNVSYSEFIRTTEPRHVAASQEFFTAVYENGDIYKGKYEGWYCLSCENYYPDPELVDGACPVHGTKPEWLSEDNYFFALSKYEDRLLKHFEENPDFVIPEFRKNEVLGFIRRGLKDFSISRAGQKWGIPAPIDSSQVIYVWFDALINYVTLAGYGYDDERLATWWPADIHVIGKDIWRFHAIYWPAMLMAAGLEIPKTIVVHGFIDFRRRKMSKSAGVGVAPADIIDKYGVDPLRYYLLREIPFQRDGSFTSEGLDARYHNELGNDLGNLLNRTVTMLRRYRDGILPEPGPDTDAERELKSAARQAWESVDNGFGQWLFSGALSELWGFVRAANRYVDATKPYMIASEGGPAERLDTILYNLAEGVRNAALLAAPAIPESSDKIYAQLGLPAIEGAAWLDQRAWGGLSPGSHVPGGKPIFPRIA